MVRLRSRKFILFTTLLTLLIAIVPALWIVRSAQASGATISLSPTSGVAGVTVQVSGSGYRHRENITVTFDGAQVASATANNSGGFSASFAVPQTAQPGAHTVAATGAKSHISASATFQVMSAGVGAWPQFGYSAAGGRFNAQETLLTASNVAQLTQDWTAPGGATTPTFAVLGNVVYIDDGNGVEAHDTATGAQLWFASTMGTGGTVSTNNAPAVDSGMVFAFGGDNLVYALNAQTGATLWTFAPGANMNSSPVVANGVVYVTDRNGSIYALNETSGALDWSYQTANGDSIGQTPAVANGAVYFVTLNGVAYALNASTGALIWQVTVGFGSGYVTAPAVDNGVVYFPASAPYPSTQGEIAAVDATTGAVRWTAFTNFYGINGLALAGGALYVTDISSGGGVYAFDEATGALMWHDNIATGESAPAVANGVVYVGAGASNVLALNPSDGATLATIGTCGGQPNTSPVVAQGVVYTNCATTVTAFHLPGATP